MKELNQHRKQQVVTQGIQDQQASPYQHFGGAALVPHGSASCRATTAQTCSLSHQPAERHQHRGTVSVYDCSYGPSQRETERAGHLWGSTVTHSCSTGLHVSGMRLKEQEKDVCVWVVLGIRSLCGETSSEGKVQGLNQQLWA